MLRSNPSLDGIIHLTSPAVPMVVSTLLCKYSGAYLDEFTRWKDEIGKLGASPGNAPGEFRVMGFCFIWKSLKNSMRIMRWNVV